jgi:hypothetical protein
MRCGVTPPSSPIGPSICCPGSPKRSHAVRQHDHQPRQIVERWRQTRCQIPQDPAAQFVVFAQEHDPTTPVILSESDLLRVRHENADLHRTLRGHHFIGSDRDGLTCVETACVDAPCSAPPAEDHSQIVFEGHGSGLSHRDPLTGASGPKVGAQLMKRESLRSTLLTALGSRDVTIELACKQSPAWRTGIVSGRYSPALGVGTPSRMTNSLAPGNGLGVE